jgi:DNA-binding GntR family transcriptional regulator
LGLPGAETAEQRVSDRVHDEILDRVRNGSYVAGERLTETRLTTEHRVSRVPLREALKRLAAEGVLDLFPNRGAVVRILTKRDVSEFFQLRIALEGFASRLTARRLDEDDNWDYFGALLEEIRQRHTCDDPVGFAAHDDRVHGGIVRRCGNQLLVKHWALIKLPLHRLRYFASSQAWDIEVSMHDHEEVVCAVLARDGDAAQELMAAHLQRVVGRLMTLNQAEFDEVHNPGLGRSRR